MLVTAHAVDGDGGCLFVLADRDGLYDRVEVFKLGWRLASVTSATRHRSMPSQQGESRLVVLEL